MKIVIIDNYDSFTYNLSHLVKELGAEVTVMRNDSFKLEELKVFDKIILSPGPGIPSIIRKSKFPQNPKRSVRFSGKGTKRSVQKRKARNTQKAETKVL